MTNTTRPLFYLWTRHGKVLQVGAASPLAATRQVEAAGHGQVLKVMDAAEWAAYNKPHPAYCRYCGQPKAICGNWCRAGGMP